MQSILNVVLRRPLPLLYAMQASLYAIVGTTTHTAELTPWCVCYWGLALIGLLIAACHWPVVLRD
jgi:hypothetical protein